MRFFLRKLILIFVINQLFLLLVVKTPFSADLTSSFLYTAGTGRGKIGFRTSKVTNCDIHRGEKTGGRK